MIDLGAILPAGTEFVKSIPEKYKRFSLKATQGVMAVFPLGSAVINLFLGKGFALSVCYFFIERSGLFFRKKETPSIELVIPFHQSWKIHRRSGDICLKENQYTMLYTPSVQDQIEVEQDRVYSIFSVHFEAWYLEPFAKCAPLLKDFLEKVERGEGVVFWQRPLYLQPQVISLINDLLQHEFQSTVLNSYFEIKVNELLLLLLSRAGTEGREDHPFNEGDLQKAEKVKEIIMQDFEKFHTLRQLARLAGTNEQKLKTAFKNLYGTSVFAYSRQARLNYAKQLLKETDWTLQHIALAVGYPEASNFSAAFKQHFGYAPGYLKKKEVQ